MTNDKRMICQVCGNPEVKEYSLYVKIDGINTELDYYILCSTCGEQLVNGLQTAIPDIVERRGNE